uniref:Uncharacterized protein n=1 Tax=Arundo donax TaxID=35708 RepID=A0A0A9FNM4_ARUDO
MFDIIISLGMKSLIQSSRR